MTANFPWPPEYVLHELLFLNHTKNNQMVRAEKGILRALQTAFRTGQAFHGGAILVTLLGMVKVRQGRLKVNLGLTN